MGRLIYTMNASLDGYVNGPDGEFGWSEPSAELHQFFNDRERSVGTHVYGRRNYETMSYWQDPPEASNAVEREYGEIWRGLDKVVVSTTITEPTTPRTTVWNTFDADRLAALVRDSELDVVVAGPTLAAHALRAGIVDEVGMVVVPVVLGGGLPLLPDGLVAQLALREVREFDGGVVLLSYDVQRTGAAS